MTSRRSHARRPCSPMPDIRPPQDVALTSRYLNEDAQATHNGWHTERNEIITVRGGTRLDPYAVSAVRRIGDEVPCALAGVRPLSAEVPSWRMRQEETGYGRQAVRRPGPTSPGLSRGLIAGAGGRGGHPGPHPARHPRLGHGPPRHRDKADRPAITMIAYNAENALARALDGRCTRVGDEAYD